MLDEIEKALETPNLKPGQFVPVTVDVWTWEKHGGIIAGLTHLKPLDQLMTWAKGCGYETEYSPEHNTLKITKRG